MTDNSPRARLNELLGELIPSAAKREKWLEVLRLAKEANLSPDWKPAGRLMPLPVVENLVGNPAALAKAKLRLHHMNPNSDTFLRLSRDVDQAENFMKGTPLFDEYLALMRSAA